MRPATMPAWVVNACASPRLSPNPPPVRSGIIDAPAARAAGPTARRSTCRSFRSLDCCPSPSLAALPGGARSPRRGALRARRAAPQNRVVMQVSDNDPGEVESRAQQRAQPAVRPRRGERRDRDRRLRPGHRHAEGRVGRRQPHRRSARQRRQGQRLRKHDARPEAREGRTC